MASGVGAFWPAQPSVAPGAKASTILTNLQRGNVPTQNISIVRNVDVYQRAGQGDLDRNDIREWLAQTGDDMDQADNNGLTMLMWAAAYGQVPTVQLLLNHGVNVNVTGKENGEISTMSSQQLTLHFYSETALHLAASCGCHELVTLLVRSGSLVDAEDENLSTPLMLASLGGHPHCVHELVLAGADVSRRNINDVRQTLIIDFINFISFVGHCLQSCSKTRCQKCPNCSGESHVVNNKWSEGALTHYTNIIGIVNLNLTIFVFLVSISCTLWESISRHILIITFQIFCEDVS